MKSLPNNQQGFSLVTAIFLVVILAGLAGYIGNIAGVQSHSTALGLQGARAYHAANAGAEWAIYRLLPPVSDVATTCGAAPSTPTTTTIATLGGTLSGFSVAVTCEYTSHQERSDTYNVYRISATATSGGSFGDQDFVSRTVEATFTDAP